MTDETPEETPETEPEATEPGATDAEATGAEPEATEATETPKRRRRSRKKAEAPAEAAGGEAAEIEPTPEDVEAVEAASEVMLEADDEAEGEAEPEEEPAAEADDEEPAAPRAPAPARRRRGERPVGPPPVVRAQAKYVRSSARKARLVCDHIRGKTVTEARAILAHTPRAVARDWSKLLESAVANAENNHELVGEDLYVKAVHADEGPTIRRFRPRAMGRATRIRKRTSHLTILLTPKD
jgi:ribosomal protein L22